MKIKFQNCKIGYKNKDIIKNFSYEFQNGDFIAIIGISGIGKTTFFNSFLDSSLIKKGNFLVDGKNLKNLSRKKIEKYKSSVSFLFQEPDLISNESVIANIAIDFKEYKNFFYKFFKIFSKENKAKISKVFNFLKIEDITYKNINNISGGQAKRVEIAKILLKKSKIILADEPTASLDYLSTVSILKKLKKITNQNKLITLVSMHDLFVVSEIFDKIIFFKNKNEYKIIKKEEINFENILKIYKQNEF